MAAPNVTITPAARAAGDSNDLPIVVDGGVAPYRMMLSSGRLPRGRRVSQRASAITGTYLRAGQYRYTVRVFGDDNAFTDVDVIETVGGDLSVTIASAPVVIGTSADIAPVIAGGVAPYKASIVGGQLPLGRRLDGLRITGTYTAASLFVFSLQVEDAAGQRATIDVVQKVASIFAEPIPTPPSGPGPYTPVPGPLTPLVTPALIRWVPSDMTFLKTTTGYSFNVIPTTGPFFITAKTVWWDPTNSTGAANDNNPGTDKAAPVLTFANARSKANVAGSDLRAFGLTSDIVVKETATWVAGAHVNLRMLNDSFPFRIACVRVASAAAPTWTASGTANVYQTTIAAADALNVVDLATKVDMAARVTMPIDGTADDLARHRQVVSRAGPAYHVPKLLTAADAAAGVAAVGAQAGTRYYDAANGILYVRAIDSRNLVGDQNMLPTANGSYARSATNVANRIQQWKGFDFIGGATPFFATTGDLTSTGVHYLWESCTFQAGGPGGAGGLQVTGIPRITLFRCGFWNNYSDGANYHTFGSDTSTASPMAFELECAFGGNGTTGSTGPSDNDTTGHDQCDIVSHSCVVIGSDDRCVADINGARRWILGGYIGAPTNPANNGNGTQAASLGIAENAVCYVYGTQFGANPYGPHLRCEGSAQMFTLGVSDNLVRSTTGAGTITKLAA